ncbi:hypothetical protein BDD12DRAFT_801138 [Trichophaea hybrida]|nr:hypothetical protein BDD12DRAFT_801138 [Trichophaea hybrida]
MRLQTSLLATFLCLLHLVLGSDEFEVAAAATVPKNLRTTTIYSWPLSASTPTPLGTVSFNPRSLTGTYTPFNAATDALSESELVRVGIVDAKTGSWISGSVTTGGLVSRKKGGVGITVRVDGAGNVWHVEFADDAAAVEPKVSVVKSMSGVLPQLNKPIVLNPDGRIPEPVVEKTFLQKYWWVLLAGVFLVLSGGGGNR